MVSKKLFNLLKYKWVLFFLPAVFFSVPPSLVYAVPVNSDADIQITDNLGIKKFTVSDSDGLAIAFINSNALMQLGMNGQTGQLNIYSEQGAADFTLGFKPSASMTEDTVYTMPVDFGAAGQYLTTDGNGILSWAAGSSALIFADSLQDIAGTVNLVGDSAAPGVSRYYGTDGAGAKGWYVFPAGSGDVLGPASNSDNYVPQWNGADAKTLKNGLAVGVGADMVKFGAPNRGERTV